MRGGPDRRRLGVERGQQRFRSRFRRRGQGVERVQRRAVPERAGPARAPDLAAPDARLERIGGRGIRQPARRAQPGQEVGGRAARERGPGPGQHARAEPRPLERHAAVVGDRDPVAGQHLREQRRAGGVPAQQHRDVRRVDALPHELEHGGADQLGLGALPARLEQAHRAVRRQGGGAGLEQAPLEVVQRRAGGRRVVLRALGQVDELGGQRLQLRDRARAAREGHAPGLVGQRDAHVGLGVADQRLDRVALRGREVVEAVQEHRPPSPCRRRGPQRVERRPGVPLTVRAPEPLQPPAIGGVQRGELVRVGGAALRGAPGPQRRREPRRRDERPLQLREQRAGRGGEAGRGGGRGQHPQRHVAQRGPHDLVARDTAQRPRRQAGAAGDLRDQPAERQDLGAEHHAGGRELALVVVDVGARGHDEQRVAGQRRAQPIEHGAGLGGVRGTGDERQGHRAQIGSRAGQTVRQPEPGSWSRRTIFLAICGLLRRL